MIDVIINKIIMLTPHDIIFGVAFYYPFLMAWVWMAGGLWFYIHRERASHGDMNTPPDIDGTPLCSILITCMNEEDKIEQTVAYALRTRYSNFEVIVIDDGSTDATPDIIDQLAAKNERLRVVHLAENEGKAVAMKAGTLAARSEYLICIDGDALLHPHAVQWMLHHLVINPRVGAVTGNPRIINRSTILGKIQVGEFSSIIGLIKRAQRTYGRIFTVSGVIAGFRRTALDAVGYWNENMITDDIDVSWRLQLDAWGIHFETRALCYIFMPETLRGLWRQRLRWAQGGVEALFRHARNIIKWRGRRFWGIAFEYVFSLVWAYCMLSIFVLYFLGLFIPLPPGWRVNTLLPQWYGAMLGITCLIQFSISLWIDRRYERHGFIYNQFWIIWYPLAYWVISMLTIIIAFPKVLFTKNNKRALWVSPDRGIASIGESHD